MLKAKLDSVRKNKKGFSLVELIIVIAIMVALIAVMAPQFVRYVQQSREATLQQAAEDTLAVAKAEFALGKLTFTNSSTTSGTITIQATGGDGVVAIAAANLVYYATAGTTTDTFDTNFVGLCGIDGTKRVRSTTVYTITIIAPTPDAPTFTMTKSS